MKNRDYSPLVAKMAEEYAHHAPASAALHQQARRFLVDGGSHALRLMDPFTPRIQRSHGAWLQDEDGHQILDFWQGHFMNILGHNPALVTEPLAQAFQQGFGLQSGFTDRSQVEVAELICGATGAERVRFTTSGTLATMYAILLARAFTGRELVLKVGGGWHGGHPWGLKGVGWQEGYDQVDSTGIPAAISESTLITGFNNPQKLHDHFRRYGDQLACFIVEPVIGTGGLMPATRQYLQTARELTEQYGVVLILDEVISGFRFRAGDAGALYQVRPDLITLGKAIGGGMPVAAVAGRADIMAMVERHRQDTVKFSGGTYSAHPASMLAAKTILTYLVENEAQVYSTLAEVGAETRSIVTKAFAEEGMRVRFAGDKNEVVPHSSLHMLLFPYQEGHALETPEEVRNPAICDVTLSEEVLQLAMILENVFIMHGLGCISTAHTSADLQVLGEAFRRVARRIQPYMKD
jgi:glutamate-1-semialdehyde 2,1-aminomutase